MSRFEQGKGSNIGHAFAQGGLQGRRGPGALLIREESDQVINDLKKDKRFYLNIPASVIQLEVVAVSLPTSYRLSDEAFKKTIHSASLLSQDPKRTHAR